MFKIKTIFIAAFFCLFSIYHAVALEAQHQNLAHKRVVVLEFGLLDSLMILGIKPVAIAGNHVGEGTIPGYLKDVVAKSQSVGTRQNPSLTAIAALKPDVILADTTFHSGVIPELKKIAPVIALNSMMATPKEQMENLMVLAKYFHQEDKAKIAIEKFNQEYQELVIKGKAHKATVLMGYVTPTGMFRALSHNSIATVILKEISKENLILQSSSHQRVEMTPEAVLAKNPQAIVILVTDGDYKTLKKLTNNPLWKNLQAVKNNKVYFMSRDIWAQTHGLQADKLALEQAKDSGFLTLSTPVRLSQKSIMM